MHGVKGGVLPCVAPLQVLFAILLAALGIAQAQMSFPDITQAAAAIDRVFGTIDRTPTIDATHSAGALYTLIPATAQYVYISDFWG